MLNSGYKEACRKEQKKREDERERTLLYGAYGNAGLTTKRSNPQATLAKVESAIKIKLRRNVLPSVLSIKLQRNRSTPSDLFLELNAVFDRAKARTEYHGILLNTFYWR